MAQQFTDRKLVVIGGSGIGGQVAAHVSAARRQRGHRRAPSGQGRADHGRAVRDRYRLGHPGPGWHGWSRRVAAHAGRPRHLDAHPPVPGGPSLEACTWTKRGFSVPAVVRIAAAEPVSPVARLPSRPVLLASVRARAGLRPVRLSPPRLRTANGHHRDERRASWLELFFDLVFAGAVGQWPARSKTTRPWAGWPGSRCCSPRSGGCG